MSMLQSRKWMVVLLVLGVIGAGAPATVSAQIAVANPGFETPVQAPGGFTQALPPGWTIFAGSPTATGVFHPTVGTWQYVAPSGNQVLYLNSATVEQQLATTVVQGEHYLLAVSVVRRPNFWNPAYRIDFFAGNVLLGSDLGTLVPANGGSLVSLIAYTAGAGDPAIGQPLKIRLGGPTQTNFDNVRVFVPEPSPGIGLTAVLLLADLARGRTRRAHRSDR